MGSGRSLRARRWLAAWIGLAVLSTGACGGQASTGADETAPEPTGDAAVTSPVAPTSTATGQPATTRPGSVALPSATVAATASTPSSTGGPSSASAPTTTVDPPATTEAVAVNGTETTSIPFDGAVLSPPDSREQVVALRFESWVADVEVDDLAREALGVLNDPRGWPRAGFRFIEDGASPFRVVLAEGPDVDALCLPLQTGGTVSCQNGPVVALNATRWRTAVEHWDSDVADYRGYLVNHEVGHLLGQRHPKPRCPVPGRPAGVMEQQTGSLRGCTGNAWPRDWEIAFADRRPVVYAPLPDWGPDPVPANGEG